MRSGISLLTAPEVHEDWSHLETITLSSEGQVLGIKMFSKYGRRERSCLAVAVVRGAILATDNQLARLSANFPQASLISRAQ